MTDIISRIRKSDGKPVRAYPDGRQIDVTPRPIRLDEPERR